MNSHLSIVYVYLLWLWFGFGVGISFSPAVCPSVHVRMTYRTPSVRFSTADVVVCLDPTTWSTHPPVFDLCSLWSCLLLLGSAIDRSIDHRSHEWASFALRAWAPLWTISKWNLWKLSWYWPLAIAPSNLSHFLRPLKIVFAGFGLGNPISSLLLCL